MKLHTLYLICDRATGDVWPDWFYRRKEAHTFVRKKRVELGRNFTGRVVKYAPAKPEGDNG